MAGLGKGTRHASVLLLRGKVDCLDFLKVLSPLFSGKWAAEATYFVKKVSYREKMHHLVHFEKEKVDLTERIFSVGHFWGSRSAKNGRKVDQEAQK